MPKGVPTSKSLDELLAGFAPSTAVRETAAEKERKKRIATVEGEFGRFAQSIVQASSGTADDEALRNSLVSLSTARQRAVKAIKSIPDEAFAPTPAGVE